MLHYFIILLTYDAKNIEDSGFLLLAVQDSFTDVGGVVECSCEALTGPIATLDGCLAGFLVQGDADTWVGDHAGDGAFLTLLHHQRWKRGDKPHLRVLKKQEMEELAYFIVADKHV